MKTRKQKETNEKEIHLLEQKGYERMMNEIMPVQQAEVYRKPTKKVVEEAISLKNHKKHYCINSIEKTRKAIVLAISDSFYLSF